MNILARGATLAATALFLSLAAIQYATAAESRYFSTTDFVAPGSDVTYFDLALQFAPGLGKTPIDGSDIAKLPHLAGNGEPVALTEPQLGSIERIDLDLNGKPAALMMFGLGYADGSAASVSVVALFDMSAKPRLLDAMDVGLDRETSFLESGYMVLSSKVGMAFVCNSHHNAGEEYLQTSMIGVWGGKLHDVDTVFSMSWNAGREIIEVRPGFKPAKGTIAVDATFFVKTSQCPETCEMGAEYPSKTERLTARYRWDAKAGKFIRPAKAFDKIPLPNMEE